jgi:hypothetical protein
MSMPNHIKNIVKILGTKKDIAEVRNALAIEEDGKIWPMNFNKVLPQPEGIQSDGCSHDESWHRANPDKCWYSWNIINWGTKWHAYSQGSLSESEFYFSTAWSTPEGIWNSIGKKFPNVRFMIRYADEDRGRNCGKFIIQKDRISIIEDFDADNLKYSERARKFASRVWCKKSEIES